MIFTPDRLTAVLAALLIALAPSAAASNPDAERLVEQARADLARGDGIAAQARLRRALAHGAGDDALRSLMGEALLAQGDLPSARKWLEAGRFAAGSQVHGWRMLGRLEGREARLAEAGRAYDRALEIAPRDPLLWVDIGRLRLAGGEQREAIEAADRALALDPAAVPALELRAVLIREQFGPAAALPWFERGLAAAPGDPDLLAGYAATLGDVGRASDSLGAARRLYRAAPRDPRALWLQAVLAARAGQDDLARRLLERVGGRMRNVPGAILLAGVLEYRAGNFALATAHFERLQRLQPDNPRANELLARTLARQGDAAQIAARLRPFAERRDASPYLLTLMARAHEELGRRDLAVPLLARAAAPPPPAMTPLPVRAPLAALDEAWRSAPRRAATAIPLIRGLLEAGRTGQAIEVADAFRRANPGAPAAHLAAGDAALAGGRNDEAFLAYREAARIRFGEAEMLRLETVLRALDRDREADATVIAFAVQNPASLRAARLLSAASARDGKWAEAASGLRVVLGRTGARDPLALADLAYALSGADRSEARRLALRAHALQPTSPAARTALALGGPGPLRTALR